MLPSSVVINCEKNTITKAGKDISTKKLSTQSSYISRGNETFLSPETEADKVLHLSQRIHNCKFVISSSFDAAKYMNLYEPPHVWNTVEKNDIQEKIYRTHRFSKLVKFKTPHSHNDMYRSSVRVAFIYISTILLSSKRKQKASSLIDCTSSFIIVHMTPQGQINLKNIRRLKL